MEAKRLRRRGSWIRCAKAEKTIGEIEIGRLKVKTEMELEQFFRQIWQT